MLRDEPAKMKKFAAGVTTLDAQMPELLTKLQQRNLGDNTLIIFTSSNGYLLGHHGLWGNSLASDPPNMYEEVVRTPMIWSWPSRIPPQTARNELISSVELVPTLCELAGTTPPPGPNASFLHFAYGQRLPKKQTWPDVAFARAGNTEMVRDDRFKLILRGQGKGPNELYDESADSKENNNEYDNQTYVSVRDRLTAALTSWRGRSAG
jgi:arylsulfatase A-like enzyme